MESSLRALLGPLFPSLDPPLIEYLAGSACEGGAAAKWKSPREAHAALGEMLESYEAVANEAEGMAKCTTLWEQMVDKGMIKGVTTAPPAAAAAKPAAAPTPAAATSAAASSAPAAKPAPTVAASSVAAAAAVAAAPVALPEVGSTCMARFSGDGLFYRARVLAVKTHPVVRISVQFIEYGDKEDVALSATKDMQPPSADDTERKGPRRTRDDDDSDSEFDSEDDEEPEANGAGAAKPPGGAKLLQNAFQIGDLEPSRAAKRAAEAAAAALAEANVPGRELTSREQKMIRKRQLKQDRLVRDAMARATWIPDTHKKAVQSAALPLYLQTQHLAKKAGTKDIALEDLSLLAPDNTELLVNTELKIVFGRRYGLIGRNGIGKSTLLRAMSTYSIPKFPTWIKIMHVEQECVAERLSVIEVVINSDLERAMLVAEEAALNKQLKELEAATAAAAAQPAAAPTEPPSPTSSLASAVSASSISTSATAASAASSSSSAAASSASSSSSPMSAAALSDRLTVLYDRLLEIDSATAHARASTILSGLQFSPEMQQMPTAALSGGWRMRVALACALFVQPDLLLLDEPTNHLDFPAVLWLESYLKSYPKSVLIVSHDRTFLNSVITDVVFFTNKKRLETFRGDYTNFLHVKAEKYKNDKRAYEAQKMHRDHLQEFITTFKTEKKTAAQDRKVGQAMSKQKVLDKMVMLENPDEESTDKFSLKFPEPGLLRLPLIAEIKNLSFKYPKRVLERLTEGDAGVAGSINATAASAAAMGENAMPVVLAENNQFLLEDISVRVELSSRIGILGANGCGKSTLVKVLLGELQPVEGLVWLNTNVRIAYFTQHHIDQLNLGLTAVEWLKELFPGTSDVACRRHLGKFGLMGELSLLQIGHLSGGQKSRLAFAIICWREPHMLILDEPTNHLDMDTIDVLIRAVNEFAGAVLIISHDQHFLSGCVKEFWSINDRRLKVFDTLAECKKATYKIQHVAE